MTNTKPFLEQGGRCKTQSAAFLRSFSVVLFFLPLLFAHTAYGDINSKLLKAAKASNTTKVEQLLRKGADVNAKQKDGTTALMLTAARGHTETVKVLIDAGTDVNAVSENGNTGLMFAAFNGHTETVKALIDAGAAVNATSETGLTALILAAQNGHTEIVEILIDADADVNAKYENDGTALMDAASGGHTEMVKALMDAGADVNAKDRGDKTALMLATMSGHDGTAKALIEAGADVSAKDKYGSTTLMIAAGGGATETAKFLIGAGLDVNAKDQYGKTALAWAEHFGHTEIVDLLNQAGPKPPEKFDSELNTPGVVFELEEVGRQRKGGSTAVNYTLKASGFPADKEYALWVIESGTNKAARICPVEVNDAGDLECQFMGQKIALRNMRMGINSHVKGEPVRYLLVSADQTVYAFVKKIPFPIEDQDGSCRISVDRSTRKGGRALLSGFPADERVEIMAKVGKKIIKETFIAEESARRDGLQKAIDLVPSRGKGGKATVDIKALSCSLSVAYNWGSKAKFQ